MLPGGRGSGWAGHPAAGRGALVPRGSPHAWAARPPVSAQGLWHVQREREHVPVSSSAVPLAPGRGYGLHGSGEGSWDGHPATLRWRARPRSCHVPGSSRAHPRLADVGDPAKELAQRQGDFFGGTGKRRGQGTSSAAQGWGCAGRPSQGAGAAWEPECRAPSSLRHAEGVQATAPGPVWSVWLSGAEWRGAAMSSSVLPAHRLWCATGTGSSPPSGCGDEAGKVNYKRVAKWLDQKDGTVFLFSSSASRCPSGWVGLALQRAGTAAGSRGGRSGRVVCFLSHLLIYKYCQNNRIY